ncbi:hypothetical protein [Methanobrevibacter oralis]|uniref:Uncharacterized protein n=1 Tax=Methanobrevibacter oralis TaxID=66851 RepID=A0A162FMG5_METOA|nr:hypothetical protein [Methanobrevibacter oralis]KZX12210.1 hypothetical protein MBORA_12860 [Methanobrevibacter oralis]
MEVKLTSNPQNNFNNPNISLEVNEKSMPIAIFISFFLNGLSMVYVENILKGVGYFIRFNNHFFNNTVHFFGLLTFIISIIIWIIG